MRKIIGVFLLIMAAASYATTKLTIPAPGSRLTLDWLNSAWNSREDTNNQIAIANYLLTEPQVSRNYEIAWQTARLVYFIGNYGEGEKRFVDTKDGVKLFNYGVEAGKLAMSLDPEKVEGNYWYAIDLGSYGLAKGILSVAVNASDGMAALKKAMSIDPTYHWYGSSRILGRYYQELPGLFGGSTEKAKQLLMQASNKAPEYDNNWVFLGQFYLKRGLYKEALKACENAASITAVDGSSEEIRFKREANECVSKAKAKLARS